MLEVYVLEKGNVEGKVVGGTLDFVFDLCCVDHATQRCNHHPREWEYLSQRRARGQQKSAFKTPRSPLPAPSSVYHSPLPERLYLILQLFQLALIASSPVTQLVYSGVIVHASTPVRELERAQTFFRKPEERSARPRKRAKEYT